MNISDEQIELKTLHNKSNYRIDDLDSEIRVDRLCSALLKKFHQHLLRQLQFDPLNAGSQAAGADYFLREFMIGKRRQNIFDATAAQIKQFAGNWYIISNLEPNMEELGVMLQGTASFYRYCADNNLVQPETADEIVETCQQTDFFQQRIEDFHAISGNGYTDWDRACPL
ncbi:hypothetical protein [Malonomonas rubra]|uniref:hypothetical protein n=1 Tax=Malonomonas rubra TaxID=57040 RepID=UPI0026ED6894|nr:hypothetical protein [Malonomonas rubra]